MRRIVQATSLVLVFVMAYSGFLWVSTPHLMRHISLRCDLPTVSDEVSKFIVVRGDYDREEAYSFAQQFAGFSGMSWVTGSMDRHAVYFGLYNLTFYGVGMNHFEFNMPFKERYVTELLTEEQCIEKSDELVAEIRDYFNSPLEYRVSSIDKVYSVDVNHVTSLNSFYYRINYDIYYNGVELLGKGTDAWVEVCDREILGYQLHFPVIEERGTDKVYLTPVEALNRLEEGSIVFDVCFGYYADYVYPEYYQVIEYGYLISGALDGDFMGVFIPAMAGDVYR